MTKKFLSFIIIVVLCLTLCSCEGTVQTEETTTAKGNYELYYTASNEDYLKFINNLDEEKYTITDILHCRYYWYVTYKVK